MPEHPLLDVIWLAVCAALVFLMQAGFMCLESGLTRSKNSINVAAYGPPMREITAARRTKMDKKT